MKKKNMIMNILLVVLCIAAIVINTYFSEFKVVGIFCIILIAVLGIKKETLTQK